MIERLLIANRGEIAVRIARTAKRLGIETVGVFSDSDRDAVHVGAVDLAVSLPGTSPSDTYLRGDLVLRAALDHECDAVHPGYGFLAENAEFARSVIEAGLIWVGPTPEQIELLGDKLAAKRAALEAGVPTTPVVELSGLAGGEVPDGVTFPALVKAAAGGGGRGMRVVRRPEEFADAVRSATREAAAAFGDGTVFVEPYLEAGRHVEVQIFGDAHGAVVHLGERDCSIQRRNQKIVEESPAPNLSDGVRSALHDGAVALARHVGYQNAGTVEFLVGADDTITFLEVNTRLQVEHPVTEAVTGFDLVEWQLAVADGQPLPVTQDQIEVGGHAIEVRLVAEDPGSGWLPAVGTLERFSVGDGVRVDSGVRSGSVVSSDYDSLLAKIVAHGRSRDEARRRLRVALQRSVAAGVTTNLSTLVRLLAHPEFVGGQATTAFLGTHHDDLSGPGADPEDVTASVVAAALHSAIAHRRADRHWGFAPTGWRNLRTRGERSAWRVGDRTIELEERWIDDEFVTVLVGEWPRPTADGSLAPDERAIHEVRHAHDSSGELAIEIDGVRRAFRIEQLGSGDVLVSGSNGSTVWSPVPRFVDHDAAETGGGPVCPLPGTVIAVAVDAGQTVVEGELLMVVEAMKMEHKIVAGGPGVVGEVRYSVGDRVDAGDLLITIVASAAGGE